MVNFEVVILYAFGILLGTKFSYSGRWLYDQPCSMD